MKIVSEDGREFKTVEECEKYEESFRKHSRREALLNSNNIKLFLVIKDNFDRDEPEVIARVITHCRNNDVAIRILMFNLFKDVYIFNKGKYESPFRFRYKSVSATEYCNAPCVEEILLEGTDCDRLLETVLNCTSPTYEQYMYSLYEEEGKELVIVPLVSIKENNTSNALKYSTSDCKHRGISNSSNLSLEDELLLSAIIRGGFLGGRR